MKRITIAIDDEVYEKWLRMKGTKSWYKFFEEAIKRLEENENVPVETVCKGVKKVCKCLSEMTEGCLRERPILKFCAEEYEQSDLIRILIMVMAQLEGRQKGIDKWIMSLAKVLILDVVSGDSEDAQRVLRELCSISTSSRGVP